jgi:hypothetical protein
MPDRSNGTLRHTLLATSLALNVIFVSCGAEAIAPTLPQETSNAEVLAALADLGQRLDSIDARTARIDENTHDGIQAIVSQLSDPESGFVDALSLGLTTSLGTSLEVCVNLEKSMGVAASFGPEAEGEVEAKAGPNVIEAKAQGGGEARLTAEVSAELGLGGSLAVALCGSAGQSLDASVDIPALLAATRSAIAGLGIDGSRLQNFVTSAANDVGTANYQSVVAAARTSLPIPSSLDGPLESPISLLTSSPELLDFAMGETCNSSLFMGAPQLQTTQARLCGLTNVPRADTYLGILNGLDGLPTTVNALDSRTASACGALGVIVPARLQIAAQSITVASQTFQTFPSIDKRLFPGLNTPC